MAVKLRRREEVHRAYRDAANALDYVRGLLAAARNGDTDAQVAIAQAIQGCEELRRPRFAKSWDEVLQSPRLSVDARNRIASDLEKCRPLNDAAEDEVGSYGKWMEQAAAGGDGLALLERAGISEGRGIDDQIADFRRAIDTGDPAVLRAIAASYSFAQEANSVQSSTGDALHQSLLVAATLDLADCDLGSDCSTQTYQLDCAESWSPVDCTYAPDLNSYYERHLSHEDYAVVDQRAQILVANFLSGRYDWPEAQAYEQALRNPSTDQK